MLVQRVSTIAGEEKMLKFNVKGTVYVIKNRTGGTIEVSVDQGTGIMLQDGESQFLHINLNGNFSSQNIYIRPRVTSSVTEDGGGVEVQCVEW